MRLFEILDHSCTTNASAPCVIYQQHEQRQSAPSTLPSVSCLTYEGALSACQRHRELLRRILVERKDDGDQVVVAFLVQNSADLLLATLACTEIDRALPVLLNTRWTPLEMARALHSQNPKDATLLVCDEANADRGERVRALLQQNHPRVSTLRLSTVSTHFQSSSVEQRSYDGKSKHPEFTQEDAETALILFTSGTVGGPKGVLLSHRALLIQAQAKLNAPCDYNADSKMLATTVPFFHVGGLNSALAIWMAGGSLVFPAAPTGRDGFHPRTVLQSLHHGPQSSPDTLVVVPAMLTLLLESNDQDRTFPRVRLVLIGGQSAPVSLLRRAHRTFPRARLVQTFACTEAASSLTFWEWHPDPSERVDLAPDVGSRGDCIGRPPDHIQLRLLRAADDAKGIITEPWTSGVMATRGPHLLTGYWRRGSSVVPDSTIATVGTKTKEKSIFSYQSPLSPDGWFVSNDLGYRDSMGRFYFSGRLADVIRTGGETVLATEVERILLQHDGIAEVAVFALPDDRYGETVCAAVVLGKDVVVASKPDVARLRNWCASRGLAGYKRPRRLFFVEALPRNSSGKLLKRLLVKEFGKDENLRSKL